MPLLLILIGVLKLAQRAALAAAGDEPMYPGHRPVSRIGGYQALQPGVHPTRPSQPDADRHLDRSLPAVTLAQVRRRTVMSSQPPYTPPPRRAALRSRTQWRIYREQQKAAWRAQREAWKAQRHAMESRLHGRRLRPARPSIVGPIIWSRIGIVGLLIYSGRIAPATFWTWYGHWWPLLLIAAGLALLGEWALDLRRTTPVDRGGGFVGILILLAILGFGAAGWNDFWGPMRAKWGDRRRQLFQLLRAARARSGSAGPERADSGQRRRSQIENPRGDVSVTAGDGTDSSSAGA